MIIVDKNLEELEKNGTPIRVGLVGSGFAGRGFMLQMLTTVQGMRLVAVSNRTRSYAALGFEQAKHANYQDVSNTTEFENVIKNGKTALTNDPFLLTDSQQIDVVVEATGDVEFGARVIMRAIERKKHVVLINAELDATLGPILKVKAIEKGVMYTQGDGDQPAVLMNLYRQVKSWGFKPVMVGNIKSLIDVRRTPQTQAKWAAEHFQRPKMVTSFADGTKIGVEMTTIANATGFPVSRRGMEGPKCDRVENAYKLFDLSKLTSTGLTDYILGAEPSFGVFVLATTDNKTRKMYMNVYKMGDGPLYTFYTPYHLSPLEAPLSVARAVLFGDAALVPLGKPVCDVVTLAKRNIKKGEKLDGIGGFLTYGAIDNYDVSLKENLLPIGLADGCIAKQDISVDTAITYDMVELPKNRLSDKLRQEQNNYFFKDQIISGPKPLSLTVGITTCYGDISILETVKSIRESQGVGKFDFIIIADRVPISNEIKKGLKQYSVQLVENKKESGQVAKQKQIRSLAKTDIVVFTQDDVLLDPNALATVLQRFIDHPKTTMISISYRPVSATSLFESIINVGSNIAGRIARYWNNGDNYISSIGRFMAFRTSMLNNFRMPPVASSDNYYYFENKKMGGEFKYISDVAVYFKNPQNMREHLRKSSRFQHAQKEMTPYFGDLSSAYKKPKTAVMHAVIQEFLENPFNMFLYFFVFAYTRILKMKPKSVLNPVWEVDVSTKRIK